LLNGLTYEFQLKTPVSVENSIVLRMLDEIDRRGASIQVFLKVNGVWQSAAINLNNMPWVQVCRDDPAGKVEEVIFMFANGEIDKSAPNYPALKPRARSPGIFASNIGCRDWATNASLTRTTSSQIDTISVSNATMRNALRTSAIQPGEELKEYLPNALGGREYPMPPGYSYYVVGKATWTHIPIGDRCHTANTITYEIGPQAGTMFSNWIYGNPASERGLLMTGLLTDLSRPQPTMLLPASGASNCGSAPATATMTTAVATVFNNTTVSIQSDGLTVNGTGLATYDPSVTGTWSLKGATN
jgi:hypothetical protein